MTRYVQRFPVPVVKKGMKKLLPLLLLTIGACFGGDSSREEEFYDWLLKSRAEFDALMVEQKTRNLESLRETIRRVGAPHVEKMIRDLDHDHSERRLLAFFGLSCSDSADARDAMVPHLRSPEASMREAAAASIGLQKLSGTPPDLLVSLLEDPEESVRHAALFGLFFLCKPGANPEVSAAVARRVTDSSDKVRSEAYMVLRVLALPSSTRLLVEKGLKDPFPIARMNAAIALSVIGTAAYDAVPALIETLRDNEHEVVHAAWSALRKITQRQDLDRAYHTWRDWYEQDERLYGYSCPEHPAVQLNRPGSCPQCNAPLKRGLRALGRTESAVTGTGEFSCPKHPAIRGTVEFICPKCGERTVPASTVPPAPAEPPKIEEPKKEGP